MERCIFNAGVHGVTVLERGGGWFLMLGNKENVRSLLDYIGTAMDIGEWEDDDSVSLAISSGGDDSDACECSGCRREGGDYPQGPLFELIEEPEAACECSQCRREEKE